MSSLPRAAPPCPEGWLSLSTGSSSSKRLKPTPRAEDDGLPLGDEMLLQVFSGYSLDTADLVRCAATCRRLRRLVSREAEFICRLERPLGFDRRFRSVAVGFFHRTHDDDRFAPPRFLPFNSFRHSPIHAKAAAALERDLFKGCRLVASRKGRLVLELRRATIGAVLRIAVFNPVTGDLSVLPALSGKDKPGHYACALLTADDGVDPPPRRGPTGFFRVLIIYKRRSFMACRSYSSDTKAWGPEGKASGAKVSSKSLGEMDAGVAIRGSVFWLRKNMVLCLRVDTLEATRETFPLYKWRSVLCRCFNNKEYNRRLAVRPDGRLCVVQVGGYSPTNTFRINVFCRDEWRPAERRWVSDMKQNVDLEPLLPTGVKRFCIRAVWEKSGSVFFAAGEDVFAQLPDLALYVLDLETMNVRQVEAPKGRCFVRERERNPKTAYSWYLHGFEMDRASYLTTLAERDGLV